MLQLNAKPLSARYYACGAPGWTCLLPLVCCLGGACHYRSRQLGLAERCEEELLGWVAERSKARAAAPLCTDFAAASVRAAAAWPALLL